MLSEISTRRIFRCANIRHSRTPLQSRNRTIFEKRLSCLYETRKSTSAISNPRVAAAAMARLQIGWNCRRATRLVARLQSVVTSAVKAPVVAAIEYNYERDGEIVVPAGAKALEPCNRRTDRKCGHPLQFH